MFEFAVYIDSAQSYMLPHPLDSMSSWLYEAVIWINKLVII